MERPPLTRLAAVHEGIAPDAAIARVVSSPWWPRIGQIKRERGRRRPRYNRTMLTPTKRSAHLLFIRWEDASIHVLSHVVHDGSSAFEGIRCYAMPPVRPFSG